MINTTIACAHCEIASAIRQTREKYGLDPGITGEIISSVLSDIRNEEKVMIINEMNVLIKEKEKELADMKATVENAWNEDEKDGTDKIRDSN